IGTASSARHDWLTGLGADQLIDYTRVAFEDVLKSADVDVVLDLAGDGRDKTSTRSLAVLRPRRLLVAVPRRASPEPAAAAPLSPPRPPPPPRPAPPTSPPRARSAWGSRTCPRGRGPPAPTRGGGPAAPAASSSCTWRPDPLPALAKRSNAMFYEIRHYQTEP